MTVPHVVIAAGWIPFVVAVVIILLFSFFYIRYYQSRYDAEVCSMVTAIAGLSVILMICALLPVDIFLVSFMKTPDGHFKDWASDKSVRESLQNAVLYTYYALYTGVLVFLFILLPFAYFFYEEGDEHESTPLKSRICSGLKYTSVFIVFVVTLLLIGGLVPFNGFSNNNSTMNHTDSGDNVPCKFFGEFGKDGWKDAISFIISFLTLVGFLLVILYTSSGMAMWPLSFIRGMRSPFKEREEVIAARSQLQERIDTLRNRYRRGQRISRRDQRELDKLEEQEQLLSRQERHLAIVEKSCLRRCGHFLWPLLVLIGVLLIITDIIIIVTLIITNVDKLMHSCGPKFGYVLPESHLLNPIDLVLVLAQQVFPVDYVIVALLVAFFFFSTIEGLRTLGIWCLCVKMYRIRPHRTYPQGLLMFCFFIMLAVLGLNILVFQLAPQYTMYGSQHYRVNATSYEGNGTKVTEHVLSCSTDASHDECLMSQMSVLLLKFCLKFWFFGAAYFWCSWGILLVFVISFFVCLVKRRKSSIDGEVAADDMDSDDESDRAI